MVESSLQQTFFSYLLYFSQTFPIHVVSFSLLPLNLQGSIFWLQ